MKDRIEQIRNGEVPEGYKRIKNKIVPGSWDMSKASELFNLLGGNAFKSSDSVVEGIRWLKIANVGIGKVAWDIVDFLPENYIKLFDKYLLRVNDIVMALTRPILNGKLKIAKMQDKDGLALLNQRVAKVIPKSGIAADYLYYYLTKPSTVSEIENVIAGTDPPNLGFADFKKIDVVYPPFPEQQKIATILSTWDIAIEIKEQLIEQKKEQKRGLMKKLLTGEVRVPGFEGEWQEVRLGDYLVKHEEKSDCNNQYPVLTSSRKGIFLQKDYFDGNDVASKDNTGYNVVPRGFFTYRHMSDDLIFKFNINTMVDKGIVSTLYPVFTTKNLDSNFLLIVLNEGKEFKQHALEQKQGGSRTYMYFSKLAELIIKIPSIEEQEKISEWISLSDKEINLLEQELEALKLQKKGLMQLLLTGIIRVQN